MSRRSIRSGRGKEGQKSLRIRLANHRSRGIIRLHTPSDNLLAATGESLEPLPCGKEPVHEHCRATSASNTCSSEED
jgi:hypothetical protein